MIPQPTEKKSISLIGLVANIEFPEEIELIEKHGAKGIGLYRTEYF